MRLPLHASVPKLAFPRPRASTTWTIPSTATLSPSYTIKVTVHDDGLPSLSASAQSGALTSGSPPQQVSFSTQLVPLLKNTTDGCIKMGCHGATNPQQGLDLTAANAFSNIVNKPAAPKAPPTLPAAVPAVAAPVPASDCNPPYYFSGTKKIFKPACL